MTSWASASVLIGLAAAVVASPVVLGFAIARAARRRERWDDLQRVRHLHFVLTGFLAGKIRERQLVREAHRAEEPTFWTALESVTAGLRRRDRLRLARPLARNPHSAHERRVLLNDSPWRQELAVRRLALLRSARSRRALRSALAAGPELVASAALRALAADHDPVTREWLLESPDRLGRRSVPWCVALLLSFGRPALPHFARQLDHGISDLRLLHAVIEVLGLARYVTAASLVERALHHDHVDIRVAAARALGRLRTSTSSAALLRALGDPAWEVRAQAARALGRIGLDAAVEPLVGCLSDRAWWVRRHSAYALARLGSGGRGALENAAAHSSDRYAREMAEEALEMLARTA